MSFDLMKPGLQLPLIVAPMFLVSGPALVRESCLNGVIGSFPCSNARTVGILEDWVAELEGELGGVGSARPNVAPWAANIAVHSTNDRLEAEMSILRDARVPVVITALGGPQLVVDRIHAWGGMVLADVNSIAYARKAAKAGVDGLILVCSGAGGHTGKMNAFAFLAAVREFFDGPIAIAGGLSNGAEIRALETAGADLAVMGTKFIATEESLADPEYKSMLIDSTIDDLVLTNTVTNVLANWLRPTLVRAGIDPEDFLINPKVDMSNSPDTEKQRARWKTVWSAGHGVGMIDKIEKTADIINGLKREYARACGLTAAYA